MIHDDGQRIALFRYQVIAPLVSLSGPRGTLKREIRRLSERFHEHPVRGRVKLSSSSSRRGRTPTMTIQ